MRKSILTLAIGMASFCGFFQPGVIQAANTANGQFEIVEVVKGYYRKNGTYVQPHYRGPSYPTYGFGSM